MYLYLKMVAYDKLEDGTTGCGKVAIMPIIRSKVVSWIEILNNVMLRLTLTNQHRDKQLKHGCFLTQQITSNSQRRWVATRATRADFLL